MLVVTGVNLSSHITMGVPPFHEMLEGGQGLLAVAYLANTGRVRGREVGARVGAVLLVRVLVEGKWRRGGGGKGVLVGKEGGRVITVS